MMNNSLTTAQPRQVTPLEIRMDRARFPRFCQYDRETAVSRMCAIITDAYLLNSYTMDRAHITYMANELVDVINEDHIIGVREITFEEIERVTRKAVLTENFIISVASLYKLLVKFVQGEGDELRREGEMKQKEARDKALRESPLNVMITAAAGALIKNNKK